MDIHIDKKSRVPFYEQIKEQVKSSVHAGQLAPGDQLPTLRELSTVLGVNFNTAALAYRDLANEGMIVSVRGRGSFIASTPGTQDMQTTRRDKLRQLVGEMLRETDRLGYNREEVGRALVDLFRRG